VKDRPKTALTGLVERRRTLDRITIFVRTTGAVLALGLRPGLHRR
jgi:hypothetical protein